MTREKIMNTLYHGETHKKKTKSMKKHIFNTTLPFIIINSQNKLNPQFSHHLNDKS